MVDFETHDSQTQIINLQNLLTTPNPTKEDVALAMFLSIMIFFKNRPGKLKDYEPYFIHGTGCHNPTSEKTGKTVWGVWRLEVTIENRNNSSLEIKHEWISGGHLKAVFKSGENERIITVDVSVRKKLFKKTKTVELSSIACPQPESLMEDLNEFLKGPLNELLRVSNEARLVVS